MDILLAFLCFRTFISPAALVIFYYLGAVVMPAAAWRQEVSEAFARAHEPGMVTVLFGGLDERSLARKSTWCRAGHSPRPERFGGARG